MTKTDQKGGREDIRNVDVNISPIFYTEECALEKDSKQYCGEEYEPLGDLLLLNICRELTWEVFTGLYISALTFAWTV